MINPAKQETELGQAFKDAILAERIWGEEDGIVGIVA